MILTLPVLLYQLLFVLIMYTASRLGQKAMLVALAGCLVWTATHVFFPPLMAIQMMVIVCSYLWFRSGKKSVIQQLPTDPNQNQ